MKKLNILYKYLNSRFKRGFTLMHYKGPYPDQPSSTIRQFVSECLGRVEKGIELSLYNNKNQKLCFVECITVKTPSM